MITSTIVLAGVAGVVLGYLSFRFLRNWGIAIITPLLVVAVTSVLLPPAGKSDPSTSESVLSKGKADQVRQKLPGNTQRNPALNNGTSLRNRTTATEAAAQNILTLASFEQSRPIEVPENGYTGSD